MSLAYEVSSQKCEVHPSCCLSGWSLVEYVIFCHVVWWITYYFLILLSKQSEEWCCRVLTFAHGCIISFLAIQDILQNKGNLSFQSDLLSETQKNYLSFMLSYFLFDFCWFHFFGNEPWVIYFHHITSIIIILKIMVSNYGGGGISYAAAGLEFSNPYLQLRWFLRTHGYLNTPIHAAVELWFFCLFTLIRTVGGTILFYQAAVVSHMDLGMKLSFLCIYGISLVLQWQIFSYFRKKYWRGNHRNIDVTNSRVSISQYFQRRTLDRPSHIISAPENNENQDNSTSSKKTQSPSTLLEELVAPSTLLEARVSPSALIEEFVSPSTLLEAPVSSKSGTIRSKSTDVSIKEILSPSKTTVGQISDVNDGNESEAQQNED